MKIFRRNISTTTAATTTTALAKSAAQTARKVEFAKNTLAIYGGIRLAIDVFNAVKVARLIKAGKIVQGDDGYWYYTDTQSDTQETEKGGVVEEEAQ